MVAERLISRTYPLRGSPLLVHGGLIEVGRSTIIEYVLSTDFQAKEHTRSKTSKFPLVAYIYCNSDLQHEQTPRALMRSILRQFIHIMLDHGENWIREPAAKEVSPSSSLESCANFLKTHLLPRNPQPIIIIDGVDELSTSREGEENRRPLIDQLLQLPIRLLITGTNVLRETFKQKRILEIHIRPVESDVRAFIEAKIEESGKLSGYPQAQSLVDAIVENMWNLLPEKYVYCNSIFTDVRYLPV